MTLEGDKLPSRDGHHSIPAPVILAVFAILFYLPYFVPQRPVASDSYLFGYNNRAAVLLLVILSAGIAVWKKGFNLELCPAGQPKRIPTVTLGICLAIQLAACLVMVLITGGFGGFVESIYEIDRVWLLAQGHIPYAGFEWPFGVLFLYGPLWLSHLLRCSVAGGYYVFWSLAALAGVVLLRATIDLLDYPCERKTSIFLLLFIAAMPSVFGMGTHYTWLRFITPFYCILIVHHVSTRNLQPNAGRFGATLAVCFTALLLLMSPEMAIAHCFASCVLLFPRRSPISPAAVSVTTYLAMLTAFAVLFSGGLKLHVLDTLVASGGGADSFPIPFSAAVVFFFAVVFVCACAVVRRWSMPSLNDNSIALIILSVPLLAAALGRCDPGHLLLNGIGLFLAVFLYASKSPRMWRLYRNTFVIVMIVFPQYFVIRYMIPMVGRAGVRMVAEESMPGATGLRAAIARFGIRHMPAWVLKTAWPVEMERLRVRVVPAEIEFNAQYPGLELSHSDGILDAPFGYMPNGFGSYHSSSVDYGYYEGIENANTPLAVQRKIDELALHPERDLLLPDQPADLCGVDELRERHVITILFFFPYIARVSHPISVHRPLCDYIGSHYAPVRPGTSENFGYELWFPRSTSPAGQ